MQFLRVGVDLEVGINCDESINLIDTQHSENSAVAGIIITKAHLLRKISLQF